MATAEEVNKQQAALFEELSRGFNHPIPDAPQGARVKRAWCIGCLAWQTPVVTPCYTCPELSVKRSSKCRKCKGKADRPKVTLYGRCPTCHKALSLRKITS